MSLDILIFGGTGFLGGHLVAAFAAAGHTVACACRGTTPVPAAAEHIRIDREDPETLGVLTERRFDVAIELATQPGFVREAVAVVRAQHWIAISSASVYAHGDIFEPDESAPIHPALPADRMTDPSDYGAAKSACEAIIDANAAIRTIIRPGLIGGAGDGTGRSGYYPWRFTHPTGADVVVPDDLDFPVSLLDVRDLADWIVQVAERRITGFFNAAGPTHSLDEILQAAQQVAGTQLALLPVPSAAFSELGVSMWMGQDSLPLYADIPDMPFIATLGADAARTRGLTHRPLTETLADALAFEEDRGGPVTAEPPGAGLRDETEQRVRRAMTDG